VKKSILFIIFITLIFRFCFAGTQKDSDAILEVAIEQSNNPAIKETLEPSVRKALNSGIHSHDVYRFVTLTAEAGREPEEVAFYLDMSTELYEMGVPAELVMNLFLEEVAKGIPEESIKNSLPLMKARMIFCKDTAASHIPGRKREHSRNLLIIGLFHAMSLGFSEKDISTLSSSVKNYSKSSIYFFNVIKITMELKNQGFRNKNILDLMTRSIKNDFKINDLKEFPAIAASSNQEGSTEEDIINYLYTSIEISRRTQMSEDETSREESKASKESRTTPGGSSSKPRGSSGSKSPR